MTIDESVFGEAEGRAVSLYTLKNRNGLVARITEYGGILTEMHVPDAKGRMEDVVLGFERLEDYLAGHPHFGATTGRVANRIAGGSFVLNGIKYDLAVNNGPNHLHGGIKGFDKAVWEGEPRENEEGPALKLTYLSSNGEEGYPGNLSCTLVYTLTENNELKVFFTAETDADTPVNLAHHSYWNLAGHRSGHILGHELSINADMYTPADETLIPTGEFAPVEGTPYDFRVAKPMGRDMGRIEGDPGGYDINFVLNGEAGEMKRAAVAYEPASGRVLEVLTTEPGVQLYTANFLDGTNVGKGGAVYNKNGGFCLETQHFPDSINRPEWPSIVLRPGETYRHEMIHRFYTK